MGDNFITGYLTGMVWTCFIAVVLWHVLGLRGDRE